MKRLDGKKEVEKILFGRELFGLRRRRAWAFAIYAAVFCLCIAAVVLVSSRKGGDAPSEIGVVKPPSVENMAQGNEADTSDRGEDGTTDGEAEDETEGDTQNKDEQETDEKNTIIYKDFSTKHLNIVNNTVFDASFANSVNVSLPKYYDENDSRPIVLILHTFTSDRYCDSNGKYGVCAVGQTICEELNSMGIGAVYSSAVHDSDINDPSENARETIEFYLKMYPSIKYVFDVGIMQEYDGDRIVATRGEYMGEMAAQIRMLVAGNNMSSGRDNLYLAAEISRNLRRGGMTLAREIVYDDSIKNSSYTPYYLEIFIGSSGNCEKEAIRSARVFAKAFAQFLN